MRPRAVLSLADLARATGVSIYAVARLLREKEIAIRGGGRRGAKRFVLLADLRRMDSDLWDSIRLARGEEDSE